MGIHWKKPKIQRDISDARIWLEDGHQSQQACDNEERLILKSKRHHSNITDKMQPEYSNEEVPERVEDFDKEVPPQPDVWRQIWDCYLCAIAGCEEVFKAVGQN